VTWGWTKCDELFYRLFLSNIAKEEEIVFSDSYLRNIALIEVYMQNKNTDFTNSHRLICEDL
jgi:hypothetical protein